MNAEWESGHARGIEVWPSADGSSLWYWAAYDGMSREFGSSTSEEGAFARAQAAADQLRRPTR